MNLFGCLSKPKPDQQPEPELKLEPELQPEPKKPIQKGCERQMPTKLVGNQCENIWATVMKTDSLFIGLHGRIGVGKTTVLNYLNNQFVKLSYDFVVFVALSSNLWALLDEIATQIGLSATHPGLNRKGIEEKSAAILNFLSGKRYAILIDDLPVIKGGFGEIRGLGLPHPSSKNQCKIVFASSEYNLHHNSSFGSDTSIIQVTPLPWEDAWILFNHEIGGPAVHSKYSSLVAKVAVLCQGLPKAIVKIGRFMQDNEFRYQWQTASEILDKCMAGSEFEDDVAEILCDALGRNNMFVARMIEPAINCYYHDRLCKIGRGLGELKDILNILRTDSGDENERALKQSILDLVNGLISYVCKS
ncbi:Disease resistance protein (CC-NBS-LRR class) family [Euphorbia peplus]|nr:Disease resistance protein (CC-NBS-LRR class) family [Euphorbia peplus]